MQVTATNDLQARVLQVAPVCDQDFLKEAEAEYGLVRFLAKEARASLPANARLHIRALLTNGSISDEPALIAALQSGGSAGAGLDVFATEPHVPEALRSLPNAVPSPHRGPGMPEAVAAMHDIACANLAAYFRDGSVVNSIPELAIR